MILDSQLNFIPIGGNLSLIANPGDIPSSNIIDLMGSGVGTAPPNIIGTATLFGTDVGIGDPVPNIEAIIGTAVVSAGGGTLRARLQAAADQGVAGNYQPDAWHDLYQSAELTAAQLVANTVFARIPFLPAFPANLQPRYLRMLFTISTAAITAGTISACLVTMIRDDQSNRYAAKNFAVA